MKQTDKGIKKLMGYCIICGKDTLQDKNTPFCESCYPSDQKPKWTKEINGKHCHFCKTESLRVNYQYPLCRKCTPHNGIDNSVNDEYQDALNEYLNMSSIERQEIKPLWTCRLAGGYKLKGVLEELEITEVLKMVEASESKEAFNANNVFENGPNSNRKIMSILKAWKNGISLNPPNIKYGDSFVFGDGRHRCLAAKFIGAETIPIDCIR